MIHFVTCRLSQQVHVPGQGFTSTLYLYTWGSNASEAERHARAYLVAQGLDVQEISPPRVAKNQLLQSCVHPEQIYGLPEAMAEEEIRSRDYPEDILQCTLENLKEKQRLVRRGLQMLFATA
jgi:hypothetical protein